MHDEIPEPAHLLPGDFNRKLLCAGTDPASRFGQNLQVPKDGVLNQSAFQEGLTAAGSICPDPANAFEHMLDIQAVPVQSLSHFCMLTASKCNGLAQDSTAQRRVKR